jgi:hypothetical protein
VGQRRSAGRKQRIWYEEGLRFSCTRCGRCCRDREEPTYVFLEEDEICALAEFLRLTRKQFLERYCTWEEDGFVLKKRPGACIFWDENLGCRVYPARPVQCRTWPFWPRNLSPEGWQQAMDFCPGCNTGQLHPRKEVELAAVEMLGRRGEGATWPEEIPLPSWLNGGRGG